MDKRLVKETWNLFSHKPSRRIKVRTPRLDELLNYVGPIIKNEDTVMRVAITPHERLTATLRFLATGRSFEYLKFSVIISLQALSNIIPETCRAIISVLKDQYLKVSNIIIII